MSVLKEKPQIHEFDYLISIVTVLPVIGTLCSTPNILCSPTLLFLNNFRVSTNFVPMTLDSKKTGYFTPMNAQGVEVDERLILTRHKGDVHTMRPVTRRWIL